MPHAAQITEAMVRAIEIVRADPAVRIIDELSICASGEAEFRCSIPVQPFPNLQGLPERVQLRVRLDSAFPYHDIDIFPEDASVCAFAHQDAETHKLCLFPERMAPWSPTRLKVYLDWAGEWLSDAATNNLLREGDPYELPDFSRRNFRDKLPSTLPLLFDETSESFKNWQQKVGGEGRAELQPAKTLRGLIVRRFDDRNGQLIRKWTYTEHLADGKDRIYGRWILLPDPVYVRHRPAQTFEELKQICRSVGIDLLKNIWLAREERNREPEIAFILAGFPIPRRVGAKLSEVHWQPLYFRNNQTDRRDQRKQRNQEGSKITAAGLWNSFLNAGSARSDAPLPWGRSENVAQPRLYARGKHTSIAAHERVVVAGCGALGAIVAEMMVRGGSPDVCLLDKDVFELGNQCRHTLDGRSCGVGKSTALAERLQSANPLSKIVGYVVSLPPNLEVGEREKILAAVGEAMLIIDCTTDEGSFRWLDKITQQSGARMVSMFVNFRATVLTLAISGRSTSCNRVCQQLYGEISENLLPVKETEYNGQPKPDDLVLPGPGCWHPTFPATNADIWMMAAAAINLLKAVLSSPLEDEGTAILLRRGEDPLVMPLEVACVKKYK